MRRYATGVMVLTVRDGAGFHAATVNSVTSVSLEPALVLVCLEKNARSHQLVHETGAFALNILSAAQVEAGKKFAFDRAARNAPQQHVDAKISAQATLHFPASPGALDCRVVAEYPGGDHTIFLAEVMDASIPENDFMPLIYFEGKFQEG
ncbi:MAG: flavin reductase [Chloroflexi bacterium]|nr:flavin reductase [Chloroflexota bacterium]